MKKTKAISTIVIIIISLVLSWGLSLRYADYTFESPDKGIELLAGAYAFLGDGVNFDEATKEYEPLNDDPWLAFDGIFAAGKGVFLETKESASEKINVKIYWIGSDEEVYSEYHTSVGKICKGQRTVYLKLPDKEIRTLRVDIDSACTVERLEILSVKPAKKYVFAGNFLLAFALQFVLIFGVLFIAYQAHLDRVAKGSKPIAGIFINEPKNPEAYRYEYDWIRTLAAVLVIMMHSVVDTYAPQLSREDPGYGVIKGVLALSLACNALYIMLSGALLLKPSRESFKEFYIKRLGRILIPTFSYFFFSVFFGFAEGIFADGIADGLLKSFKGLLTGRPEGMPHMWFIYAIIPLYILAPFLRKIIENISEAQLFGLVLTGFAFDCCITYVPLIFGVEFGMTIPISGWLGLFLLGYYMTTGHAQKLYIPFILMGALGVGVTLWSVYFYPEYLVRECNETPVMWLVGAGIFAFFSFFKKIFGKKNYVIASVAKFNFSIMLIHIFFLYKVVLPIGWRLIYDYGHLRWCLLGMIGCCFVLSYAFSLIYENTAIIAANYIYGKITKK